MKALIVGVGPSGLTTAVVLTRRGIVSEVIDLRESGSGFFQAGGIMPASLEFLRPSGAGERRTGPGEKKAIAEGRTLVFADQSGFYLLPMVVRTYAPAGHLKNGVTRSYPVSTRPLNQLLNK